MKRSAKVLTSLSLFGIVLFQAGNNLFSFRFKSGEIQDDGPYVFYKKDKMFVKYILDSNGIRWVQTDTVGIADKKNYILHVSADIPGQTFSLSFKDQLQNESSEFQSADKIVALSDMEGDFASFRKLLQSAGVIDSNFNWTFGKGHLVLVGDFVDRGSQVTEVLWLTYSLEEKAKQAGGYVHYILGNHEIMNLSEDLRYVAPKYYVNAKLMHKRYENFFDSNTELGKWLRTKNIVEKIGKLLFAHGGISEEVNNLKLSVARINQMARPYYASSMDNFSDDALNTVLSNRLGPFWYRGYYNGNNKATQDQLNKITSDFDVLHIITGHTVASDTISTWYEGKVIDLDVHDNRGRSEALLIEDNKFYRVTLSGQKYLISE